VCDQLSHFYIDIRKLLTNYINIMLAMVISVETT